MLQTSRNMAVNGTVVGEALPVSIPYEVQGVLVATLGMALAGTVLQLLIQKSILEVHLFL